VLQLGKDGRSSFNVNAMPPPVFFEEIAAALSDAVKGTALYRDSSLKGREESFEKVFIDQGYAQECKSNAGPKRFIR
jgi:hypothetical protein